MELGSDILKSILALTYAIGEAQDASELRYVVLNGIGRMIEHDCSFFDLCSKYRSQRLYFDPLSTNMGDEQLAAYYKKYADIDYTGWLINQTEVSFVYRDSDYFTDRLRQQSRLYKEWLQPLGVYYSCGINIIENKLPYGSLTLFRSHENGDFSDEEVEILVLLTPHIAQRFVQIYPNGVLYNAHQPQFGRLKDRYMLTGREDEVVRLMYAGSDTGEIAQMLFISQSTVRKHVANIYKKLNVRNRQQFLRLIASALGSNAAAVPED